MMREGPIFAAALGVVWDIWLAVWAPASLAAADYGIEPSENIVLDNQPGTWRLFMRWKTPDLVSKNETPLAVPVPVAVTVHDWTLPEPRDDRTFMDLIQSPETVALRYQVPLWSEAHWRLLEPSLRLLGEIGDRSIYVRMINGSHLGDTQT